MRQPRNCIWSWARFLIVAGIFVLLVHAQGRATTDYLFAVVANTGKLFSFLLGGIFMAGMFVLLDRVAFFTFHTLCSRKLIRSGNPESEKGVYGAFIRAAREFRATSAEGVYSEDIVDRARQVALRDEADGQEFDRGRSWLEFLGTVAPTVGFMGTLVGLIASFQELGFGGQLMDVLEGLALSMTTSLLGAAISLIFLSSAWLLGRARESFDETLAHLIAEKQQEDRVMV